MVAISEEIRVNGYKFSGVLVDEKALSEEVNRPNNPDILTCLRCGRLYHKDMSARHNEVYHKPKNSAYFNVGDMVHVPANEFGATSGQYQIVAIERIGERNFYIVDYLAGLPRGVSESVLIELNYTPMYSAPIELEASPDATGIEVATVEPVTYGVQAPGVELPRVKSYAIQAETVDCMFETVKALLEAARANNQADMLNAAEALRSLLPYASANKFHQDLYWSVLMSVFPPEEPETLEPVELGIRQITLFDVLGNVEIGKVA